MKKRILLITAGLLLVMTAACNKDGKPVELASACDKANDEAIVEVDGFIDDGGGVYCSKGRRAFECGFQIKNTLEDKVYLKGEIEVGTWANNVEKIKRGYSREDIKIWTDESKLVDLSKKAKVTGRVHVFDGIDAKEGLEGCYMTVTKIVQK